MAKLKFKLRRSTVPVRAKSWRANNTAGWFAPIDRAQTREILAAAEEFEFRTKTKGKVCGKLGTSGLQVLKALCQIVNFKDGRLEPSIAYISKRINRCSKTVVEALKRLRQFGFIDWKRRYEETAAEKEFGSPQLRQITNAYRLLMPKIKGVVERVLNTKLKHLADNLLGVMQTKCPLPEDIEQERRTRLDIHMEYMRQKQAQERQKTQIEATRQSWTDLPPVNPPALPLVYRDRAEQLEALNALISKGQ